MASIMQLRAFHDMYHGLTHPGIEGVRQFYREHYNPHFKVTTSKGAVQAMDGDFETIVKSVHDARQKRWRFNDVFVMVADDEKIVYRYNFGCPGLKKVIPISVFIRFDGQGRFLSTVYMSLTQ